MKYSFSIPVKPVAKQSFRAVAVKKGKIHGFTPSGIGVNKETLRKHIVSQLPRPYRMLTSQVTINKLHFIFQRPEALKKALNSNAEGVLLKNTKPDIDNLVKQILDALKGLVMIDENIVSRLLDVGKFYGEEDMIFLEMEGE